MRRSKATAMLAVYFLTTWGRQISDISNYEAMHRIQKGNQKVSANEIILTTDLVHVLYLFL